MTECAVFKMANTYDRVLSVIGKPPEKRQAFEIQGLLPWLRKKSKLFSTLKTDCLKDIVRNCGVQKFKRGDIIIKQGEIGECFYIILGGKISIYIINKEDRGGEESDLYAAIGTRTSEGKLDRSKLGNFVAHLGSGVPFGEVALVSDDAIRTASIIAEEDDTDLLVVDRALYNRAVRDVLAAEFEEKKEFIRSNPLFADWQAKYKKQLTMAMYKETYPYDATLVKQGDPVSNIYFIISGQVEIRTDSLFHRQQYPKMYELLEDEREKLIKQKKKAPDVDQPSPPLRKRDSSKFTKLCYLGRNESLGEIEVLMDMDSYMSTAVCAERTEVLVLEMKHYDRLFVRRHQRTIAKMRRDLEAKLQSRSSVLKERGEILLLRLIQMKLHAMHSPPAVSPISGVAGGDRNRRETSVQSAEKLFFSHQGPLLDMDGPGSVFYMIRARERSRLKRSMLQKEKRSKTRPGQGQTTTNATQDQGHGNGHLHAIRLPQNLVMAAQLTGASEFRIEESEHESSIEHDVEKHPQTDERVNDINSNHNNNTNNNNNNSNNRNIPSSTTTTPRPNPHHHSIRVASARSHRTSGKEVHRHFEAPETVRRIKSAAKHKIYKNNKENTGVAGDEEVASRNEFTFKSLPSARHMTMLEDFKVDDGLRRLEEKVEEWLKKADPKAGTNVSKLRRLHLEDIEPPPKLGNKIVIRRRTRTFHLDSSLGTVNSSSSSSDRSETRAPNFARYTRPDPAADPLDKFKILLSTSS